MEIKEIADQIIWNTFLLQQNYNTFLHSSAWIEFNRRQKHESWQYGLFDDGSLVSIGLVLKYVTRRGTFLVVPHGVQEKRDGSSTLHIWSPFLKSFAKKQGCSFVRIQPIALNTEANKQIFSQAGFRVAPLHLHTEYSSALDISKPIDEILLGMRKTTRQMCKKGEKLVASGQVEIVEYDSITNDLYEVYRSTFERGNFVPYSQQYLQDEYESFAHNSSMTETNTNPNSNPNQTQNINKARLFAVKNDGKILSFAMILISGKRAFYHQGANILSKEIPASYLAQWTGIQWAKEQGCESYDFWGVSPAGVENHPWKNISLFKRGFGGVDVDLLHAQDLRVDIKYWLTWCVDTYRAKKRGF